jgi:amidase
MIILAIASLAALLLAGCTAVVTSPPGSGEDATVTMHMAGDDGEGAVADAPARTIAILGGLSYGGLFESAPITLAEGAAVYTDAGSGEEFQVSLLDDFAIFGALDGDDFTDAVALLELDSQGSGRFTYLAPVLDVWNTPRVETALELGDRVQVQSVLLADGQVVVDYIGYGPGDADCCPSYNRRNTYAWQEGALVEISNEELGKAELSAEVAPVAAAPADELAAIPDEDFVLFMAATQAAGDTFTSRLSVCPEVVVPGGRQFPLAEPDYNAKRALDLTAFAPALESWTPEQAAALDELLAGQNIPAIQELMDAGQLSSVELVTYYADRIARYDVNKLNSVLELNPDALALAAELDAERTAPAVRGPLHGIPVLLKDNIATGDQMHTTAGAVALQDWRADRDAFLVQQLRGAGAIILGKANLSEWANYVDPCTPNGFSALGGQTRNPFGPYDTLGSSSGSAASVAANLTTVSVGSETAGSLVQPARYNGVVGMRPSQGLVSRDHVIPLGPDLDTPGPMGRSVTDVALLLTAMAGVDANDAKTADAAALAGMDFTQFLSLVEARKLRVGVIIPTQAVSATLQGQVALLEQITGQPLSDADRQALLGQEVLPTWGGDPQIAIDALAALGIEVVRIEDVTLPQLPDTARPLLAHSFRAGLDAFFAGLPAPAPVSSLAEVVAFNAEDPANRVPFGQAFLEAAAADTLTDAEYDRVRAVAQAFARTWIKTVLASNDVDVLVSGMTYASSAGAAGVPALTIPAGFDPSGRPQGVILSGDYLSDPKLLSLGYALEQQLQGRVEPDLDAVISTFP